MGPLFCCSIRWVKSTVRSLLLCVGVDGRRDVNAMRNKTATKPTIIHIAHKMCVLNGTRDWILNDAGSHTMCYLWEARKRRNSTVQEKKKQKLKGKIPISCELSRCVMVQASRSKQHIFTNEYSCECMDNEAEQMPNVLFNSVGCYWISLCLKCRGSSN